MPGRGWRGYRKEGRVRQSTSPRWVIPGSVFILLRVLGENRTYSFCVDSSQPVRHILSPDLNFPTRVGGESENRNAHSVSVEEKDFPPFWLPSITLLFKTSWASLRQFRSVASI